MTDQPSRRLPIALIGVVGVLLCLPAIPTVCERPRVGIGRTRHPAHQHLRQIAIALVHYHDEHKSLPPAVAFDPQGRALYSWRVLLLPYLEEEELHREFRLDETWNSPANLRLLPRIPSCFTPVGKGATAPLGFTPYQVFVGKGAAFEEGRRMRIPEDFPDGCSRTIAVVEASEAVPWTAPIDLPFTPDRPLPKLGSAFASGFYAAMVDGGVRTITNNLSEASLRTAITRNAGDKPGPDWDE